MKFNLSPHEIEVITHALDNHLHDYEYRGDQNGDQGCIGSRIDVRQRLDDIRKLKKKFTEVD